MKRDKKNKRYLVSGIENNKPGREKVIKTIIAIVSLVVGYGIGKFM